MLSIFISRDAGFIFGFAFFEEKDQTNRSQPEFTSAHTQIHSIRQHHLIKIEICLWTLFWLLTFQRACLCECVLFALLRDRGKISGSAGLSL